MASAFALIAAPLLFLYLNSSVNTINATLIGVVTTLSNFLSHLPSGEPATNISRSSSYSDGLFSLLARPIECPSCLPSCPIFHTLTGSLGRLPNDMLPILCVNQSARYAEGKTTLSSNSQSAL